jgi:DNA-binding transcriptional LysR family regulator
MELRQLRYFRTVAETLNFSRASELLHVAQPAVSRQIQSLEDELGVRLLDRNRQRVLLTDEGRHLLARAEKILAEVDMAVEGVRQVASGRGGELIIGSDWRLSFGLIQDSVARFRQKLPGAELSFRELAIHEQVAALHARRIHLGFMPTEFVHAGDQLETLKVLSTDIVVAVPLGHRLSGRRRVELSELAKETWLQPDSPNNSYRNFIIRLCRLAGFTPIFGRVESSVEGLLSMVAAGYGISLLPRIAIPSRGKSLRFLRSDCEPLEFCAVWLGSNHSLLLRTYLGILRGELKPR